MARLLSTNEQLGYDFFTSTVNAVDALFALGYSPRVDAFDANKQKLFDALRDGFKRGYIIARIEHAARRLHVASGVNVPFKSNLKVYHAMALHIISAQKPGSNPQAGKAMRTADEEKLYIASGVAWMRVMDEAYPSTAGAGTAKGGKGAKGKGKAKGASNPPANNPPANNPPANDGEAEIVEHDATPHEMTGDEYNEYIKTQAVAMLMKTNKTAKITNRNLDLVALVTKFHAEVVRVTLDAETAKARGDEAEPVKAEPVEAPAKARRARKAA